MDSRITGGWIERFKKDKFDEDRMVMIFTASCEDEEGDWEDEVELPARFEVCHTCDGKGKHVNPSIDSHGISSEEFIK